ncbi:MAG: hypothetical protein K9H49_14480 [Bacteroidales bacterium]|nr:hypothetical protein [Bacteroidales bacterium]MCF8391721.1 hypothetical protein [Bacteroidales bacterium]
MNLSHFFLILFVSISLNCTNQSVVETNTDFKIGEPARVGPSDYSSALSYYNTSPESPDGRLIAYTRFLSMPQEERSEKVPAEIWVCNADLTNHKKIVEINSLTVHNGANVQWLNNNSFAFQDDSVRVVDVQGNQLIDPIDGEIGHKTLNGKLLYSSEDKETGLSTIYEYIVQNNKIIKLADAIYFKEVVDLFPSDELREVADMRILHLQYNHDGSKIAFRMDIGPRNEKYNHLINMNIDGNDIHFFGPKPMHFS